MDRNSYALGMSIAHNMLSSGIKEVEFNDFAAGFKAVMTGVEPEIPFSEAGQILEKYFAALEAEQKAQADAMGAAMREEGEVFLKMNAEKEGVKVLPSGLQYKVLNEGTGKKPKAADKVKCHYEGTFLNGAKFDSSYDRNEPAVFGLNQVIAGWTEGLQLMSEGSKYELYIPYNLAYGENGAPGAIPPYATLKFVVELIEVL
ncbi:MAG: FKBP-type peptidyl-prolyl cis-trans isomerase [Bacteroidales bacterium]|nr:FKBP-type peptidyl-prolyl cis-trans isomerase [Bacteroidales bacterium]